MQMKGNAVTSPLVKYRRLGTFLVPFEIVIHSPQLVTALMQDCLVLGAYRDNPSRAMSYLIYNGQFEEVPFGAPIPEYAYSFQMKEGNLAHVNWMKVGKRKFAASHEVGESGFLTDQSDT